MTVFVVVFKSDRPQMRFLGTSVLTCSLQGHPTLGTVRITNRNHNVAVFNTDEIIGIYEEDKLIPVRAPEGITHPHTHPKEN